MPPSADTYSRRRLLLTEAKWVALILLAAWAGGWWYLANFTNGPCHDYNNAYGKALMPAVLCATGHGVSGALLSPVPGLLEFLDKKSPNWDPRQMPERVAIVPLDAKFVRDRLYMFYAVAAVWRAFGFSWNVLNGLVAAAFAVVAALSYGIFRLGMRRAFSLAGVAMFLLSPTVLFWVPSMRDFFRAPPILATVLICGYLATRQTRSSVLLLLAGLLGGTIGLGVGFRQDAIICVPPAVLTFVALAQGEAPRRIFTRLLAVGLFAAAFAFAAWPILRGVNDDGGNNAFYLLQGYSETALSQLHVQEASYVPIYSNGDLIVHGSVLSYEEAKHGTARTAQELEIVRLRETLTIQAALTALHNPAGAGFCLWLATWLEDHAPSARLHIWSRESEQVARRLESELLLTFPADFIARWYSAVVRSMRGLQGEFNKVFLKPESALALLASLEAPLSAHLDRWGALYGSAALLLLGARSIRLALAAGILVLYFCGYSSLSFHIRHAFHLQLVALWIPCFLLDKTLLFILGLRRSRETDASVRRLLRPLMRAVSCVLIAGALLLTPLYVGRYFQSRSVGALAERYANAELELLPWEEREQRVDMPPGSVRLFCPKFLPGLDCPPARNDDWLWTLMGYPKAPCTGVRTQYLVAEMEVAEGPNHLGIRYQDNNANLQMMLTQQLRRTGHGNTVRCFFPVYGYPPNYLPAFDTSASRFAGIEVRPDVQFKAFYRVRNRQDFPINMTLWLPSDRSEFKWHQGVASLWKP